MHKRITMRKRLAATVAVMLAIVLGGAGLAWADFSNPREADGFNTYRWHQVCKEGAQHARATAYFVGAGGDCRDGELKMAIPGGDLVNNLDRRVDELESVEAEPGPAGQDGVSGYEVDGFYTADDGSRLGPPLEVGEVRQLTSECADGKHAIAGGFSNGNTEPGSDLTVRESHPSGFEPIEDDPEGSVRATSWSVTLENETETPQHAQVFVVCAVLGE